MANQSQENLYFDTNGVPANGILGGLSVAEQTQDYILAVKEVTSTTPEIINQTQYAIEYIVDKDGGVRTPNQDNETNTDIIQNFPIGKNVVSQLVNATSANTQLSGELNVTGVGTIRNILYSQTGIPSSSYSTESVVFVTSTGAPAQSANSVSNILGSMVSSSAFSISSNTWVKNYTVTLETNSDHGTAFTGSTGVYQLVTDDLEDINSVTFRVSYTVLGNATKSSSTTVNLYNNSIADNGLYIKGSDIFSVPPNQSINRSFTVTIPRDEVQQGGNIYQVAVLASEIVTFSSLKFEVTATDPPPTPNIPAGDFWSTGSDSTITWLTGSAYISLNYGNLQDTSNFTAATKTFGLDPINTTFELQKGDKIRFGYTPSNTFIIYDIITPSEASDGLLKVKLNRQVPNSIVPDNFILYRIDTSDPKYIILDANKTSVLGDPENPLKGYIYPKYQSRELKQNIKFIQREVSQLL